MKWNVTSGWIVVSACCLLGAGCGKTKYKIVDVKGKIAFQDGKPLPNGTKLIFQPAVGMTGGAWGITDDAGSFQVEHVNGSDGAELGKYTVLLAAPTDNSEAFYSSVPKEYVEGGVFAVEVKEGMPPLELKVKTKTAAPAKKS
jgi:hypothetical protein